MSKKDLIYSKSLISEAVSQKEKFWSCAKYIEEFPGPTLKLFDKISLWYSYNNIKDTSSFLFSSLLISLITSIILDAIIFTMFIRLFVFLLIL